MKITLTESRVLSLVARTLFCAAVLILATPLAFSQESTGSVQGTVKDQAGAAVPGAKVTISGPAMVRPLEAVTDGEGAYVIAKVPSGVHTVTVTHTGFRTVKNEEVNVTLGNASRVDVTLAAGNVAEAVTIVGSNDSIDVTSSKASTNITEQFFDNTPKGRNFHSLLLVAPGVRPEPKAGSAGVGGIQVNGASGSENTFVIDGVEVTDVRRGSLGRQDSIPFEFLREVQVKTAGFEAEYGGTLGGVINAVTKSGTDEFHGEGYFQFTGSALNANFRGLWQGNRLNVRRPQFFRQREDDYQTYYPGFTLGGPIIKERLHFFVGYSPEVGNIERTVTFTADNSTRTSKQDVLRHYGVARVDYAPTEKIQISSSYFWNPVRVTGNLFNTDGNIAPPSNDLSIQGGYAPASNYTASFIYTPTSKLILEARYGYKYLNDKGAAPQAGQPAYAYAGGAYGKSPLPYLQYQTNSSSVPGVPAEFAGSAGFTNVTSTFLTLKDITTRHNVYVNASYIARLFGQQHNFKGGYALNRISNQVQDDYTNGFFQIYWGEGFSRGTISGARGPYGYYIWQDGVRHNSQVSSRNHGLFIQDSWQVHPRLTINAGLRFENEFLPPYVQEVNGREVPNPIAFGWGDKISPLIGAAWDITGDGKWKLSGGYGQYFDLMKYELARGSFGGDYWHSHVYTLNSPDLSRLSKATPGALGTQIIDIDNRTIPINAQGQIDGVDPDIKPMSTRQFTVALEHEFARHLVGSVRYTRSRLVRGIEDIGTLDANESEVYVIGNPGFGMTSDKILGLSGQPLTPRAMRNYDGVEFRVDGRFNEGLLNRFNYNVSYTYSRLYGNWAGLANSDENGRSDPNVSRAFDLFYGNYDSKGRNVYGLLATDRPHTFKFFGSYDIPWQAGTTTLSLSQIAFSGTPLTSEATVIVPVFYNGRGDLGRTPTLTQTDLYLAHTVNLTERVKMRFDINMANAFNQAAVTNVTQRLNRSGSIVISDAEFFGGFDAPSKVSGLDGPVPSLNPVYNLPLAYQGNREIRLGLRFTF